MQSESAEFQQGPHLFRITNAESCMVRTITLSVRAGSAKPEKPHWIEIYRITEGDYVWNTLVVDQLTAGGMLDLIPAFQFLREYAPKFAIEHPNSLTFSNDKKANEFSKRHLKTPINLRGNPYPVPYPGSS